MKWKFMFQFYVQVYSIQWDVKDVKGCGGGCSVSNEVINLIVQICESWLYCSLLTTKNHFYCDVIVLVY